MITIVSGLPRSGTSMMMQMLRAGGMPILANEKDEFDEDNPRGYLEWSGVTNIVRDPQCIAQAEGKAVKLVSRFLFFLPRDHEYRIILMQRPLSEVLASMEQMARRRSKNPDSDPAVQAVRSASFDPALRALSGQVDRWLPNQQNMKTMRVEYHDVIIGSRWIAVGIYSFLRLELNQGAMQDAVKPELYRTKTKAWPMTSVTTVTTP
jgi:hypothetical protein